MAGSQPGQTAYSESYSVHTGTDIYAVFNDTIITTSQGISYSITRQKAPVYTLGSVDARSVARSKRGIAGSMIMTTFDRHCLGNFMRESLFAADKDSIENSPGNPHKERDGEIRGTPTASDLEGGQTVNPASGRPGATGYQGETPSTDMKTRAQPMFADQILPFDTTLAAKNEYDKGSSMRIFGLEILNEGSGVSIDDTSNEVQLTYIARLLTPWVEE